MLQNLKFVDDKSSTLPKYQRLANCIEHWLKSSRLPKGTKLPCDRELAEHLGTTAVTLSKGLNLLVCKGILERKIGSGTYVADTENLNSGPRRIGIVCSEIIKFDPGYCNIVLEQFYRFWHERGFQLVSLLGVPQNYEKLIQDYELSGVMCFVPKEEFHDDLLALFRRKIPFVSIGIRFDDLPVSFGTNHEKVASDAALHLVRLGHRKIAMLYNSQMSSSRLRCRGYSRVMWEHGLPVNPDWVIDVSDDGTFDRLRTLLVPSDRPTALLADVAQPIPLIYETVRNLGLRIPEDVSVVGFTDQPYLTYMNPPMTVFSQRIQEFTLLAARQLESLIRNGVPMEIEERFSGGMLIDRASCRKID